MDWNRAKNIIIVLLFALNLFLLGNYLYTRNAQANDTQTQTELSVYLESRGVKLSCPLPKKAETGRRLMIAESTDKLAERALPALLGQEMHFENGEAVSGTGSISWVAGEMEGQILALPGGGEADLDAMLSLLSEAGISTASVERSETGAVLTGLFGDPAEPVYNMRLQLAQDEEGVWHISGRWFLGTPTAAGEDREREAAGLLVTFADRLLTQETPLGEIGQIERGWVCTTLPGVGTQLTPALRITTDAGVFHISALDGQALELN